MSYRVTEVALDTSLFIFVIVAPNLGFLKGAIREIEIGMGFEEAPNPLVSCVFALTDVLWTISESM